MPTLDDHGGLNTMTAFHMITEWHAAAPRAQVWDALLDYRQWPAWWRGFRRVDQLQSGDSRGVGMVLRQQWRSLLPLTLTLDLEIRDIRSGELLVGRIAGDMIGTARWTLDEDGRGSLVRFVFDVRPARRWMQLPVPFADRVFVANYDAIMRWGGEGLARRLDAGVVDLTPRARLAGA